VQIFWDGGSTELVNPVSVAAGPSKHVMIWALKTLASRPGHQNLRCALALPEPERLTGSLSLRRTQSKSQAPPTVCL
jgi:hypothetical protein